MPSVVQGKPGVRLVVSGARGRQGAGSGALGTGSVDADKLVSSSVGLAAILDKLGLGAPVRTATVKTVGTGQDFANLSTAWAWAQLREVTAPLTFSIVGEIEQTPIKLQHAQSHNIYLTGATLTGDVPLVDDMINDEATNVAEIATRFPSRIKIVTPGSNKYGLGVPNTLGGIEKLFIYALKNGSGYAPVRYLLAVGQFENSYLDANGRGSLPYGQVALYGGVWGLWARDGYVTQTEAIFSGGQAADATTPAGGPLGLEAGSTYRRSPTLPLELFAPLCQYGLYSLNSTVEADGSCRIAGASGAKCQVGIKARGGQVSAVEVEISACESAWLAERGAVLDLEDGTASGCDASSSTAVFEVDPGNSGVVRTIAGAGFGSKVSARGFTFTGASGNHLLYTGAGAIMIVAGGSSTGHDLDNSVATAEGLMGGIDMSTFTIATPAGGSATAVNARRGAFIDVNGVSGSITASPAADTNAQGLGKVIDQ